MKNLRAAILPELIRNNLSEEERGEHWRQLAACYYVQQMSHYPRDYVRMSEPNIPEHILETVERFEEDFTDDVRLYGPLKVIMKVGEAIDVSSERVRGHDPVMDDIHDQLTAMLAELSNESPRI